MNAVEGESNLLRDGWGRFRRGWMWVLGEYLGVAALIAAGLLWTRIPEKNGGQVALTLSVPVLILAAFLWLQAGFMHSFLPPATGTVENRDHDEPESRLTPIVWGAATLLLWIAIGWLFWLFLDKLDDRIWQWASYLNSKFDPHQRTHWASFAHLVTGLTWLEWGLRWAIVPGLLIPASVCSAAWGIARMPWGRIVRVWMSWKWWPVVLLWSLVGEAWPQTWFDSLPHGSVRAQVWRVGLKVAGAYLLGVTAWVKVLGWGAMRISPRPRMRTNRHFVTLGLETPQPTAEIRTNESSSQTSVEPGMAGRPLPRGDEDVRRNS